MILVDGRGLARGRWEGGSGKYGVFELGETNDEKSPESKSRNRIRIHFRLLRDSQLF